MAWSLWGRTFGCCPVSPPASPHVCSFRGSVIVSTQTVPTERDHGVAFRTLAGGCWTCEMDPVRTRREGRDFGMCTPATASAEVTGSAVRGAERCRLRTCVSPRSRPPRSARSAPPHRSHVEPIDLSGLPQGNPRPARTARISVLFVDRVDFTPYVELRTELVRSCEGSRHRPSGDRAVRRSRWRSTSATP